MRFWLPQLEEDRMKSSFKTALIAAVVSAFVAAGAAVATTKTFVLGTTNTVDAASTVSASGSGLNTKMLQLTNTNSGSSATALGLSTAPSRPPMIVSSDAKVAKLNADELDGIDSAGFMKGRGTFLANRIAFGPSNEKPLLTIPGLGYLVAQCLSDDTGVYWFNDTGGNVDVWVDSVNSHFAAFVGPPGVIVTLLRRANGINGATLSLGVGNDPGARRTALLHVFGFQGGDNAPCRFQVQGTLWTS
jgi:hypothetical protein